MVDNEMLTAISNLLDTKFEENLEPVNERLERIENDVTALKGDVTGLKEDVAVLKEDVTVLKTKVSGLERVTAGLSEDMRNIKVVQLENNIIPRLNTIESYYVETSRRYVERTEQIDTMQSNMDILMHTVEKHSAVLQKIS